MRKILVLLIALMLTGCKSEIITDYANAYLMDPTKDSNYNTYIENILKENKEITVIDTVDEDDYLKKIKDLSNESMELVISTESLIKNARDNNISFKNQKFACLSNEFVTKYLNENVIQVTFKTNNAAFLAGAASGYYAVSNGQKQVGYIKTSEDELENKLLAGFEDGVWQEYPECVVSVYTMSEKDNPKAVIDKMVENGVSLIFVNSSLGGSSIINEAAKRKENGENIFISTYDIYPSEIGLYHKTIEDPDNKGEEIVIDKNVIFFRVYDDFETSIDYILKYYNSENFSDSITSASETCFITEVLNDGDNIDNEQLEEKISLYREKLNSSEIIVRSSPSNPNVESRVKIVE